MVKNCDDLCCWQCLFSYVVTVSQAVQVAILQVGQWHMKTKLNRHDSAAKLEPLASLYGAVLKPIERLHQD